MTRIAGTPAYLNAHILADPAYVPVTPLFGTPRQFAMPPPLATLVPMRALAPTLSDEPMSWPSRGRIARLLAAAALLASLPTLALYFAQPTPEDEAQLVAGLPIEAPLRAAEALAARPVAPPVVTVDRSVSPSFGPQAPHRPIFPPRQSAQRPKIQPPSDPTPFVLPSVLPPLTLPLPPAQASPRRPRIRVPRDHGF